MSSRQLIIRPLSSALIGIPLSAPPTQTEVADRPNFDWLLADASLFGVVLIWGINMPVMKIGLEHMNVYAFNAGRLTLSAAVLMVIAIRARSFRPSQISRSMWKHVAVYAFIASGLYQVLFLLGIARTTSGNAALIMTSVPMWTALLARFLIGERLSRMAWTGLIGAFVGTCVVTATNGVSGDSSYFLGNVIMLIAALTWSYGTVKSRQILTSVSPLTLSAIASVSMLPLHFMIAGPNVLQDFTALTRADAFFPILYSGIFSTGFALAMWNFGVRQTGAAHASVYQNLIPVIAMLSAWMIRGETVSLSQIMGGVMIIGGLMIMRRARN
ncbi:DMT family transporter [Thalassoglobus sp. JC818]|uniref:DMT family transporter n=1 Tax=Thalassoglobus sp. JC818 TaxID=3232136 RepID=UPI0034596F32